MNKKLKNAIATIAIAGVFVLPAVNGFAQQTTNHTTHTATSQQNKHPYTSMMDTMMMAMHKAEANETRCTSTNFLAGMIPHHEGAIVMAQYELQHGKNDEMKTLAKSIIAEQTREIKLMKKLLSNFKTCPANEKITQQYQKAMAATMEPMMKNFPAAQISAEKNPDRAFALAMVPHHQAAVDMAKVILQYSRDPQVTKLAKEIIASQEKEIQQMNTFLAKTK